MKDVALLPRCPNCGGVEFLEINYGFPTPAGTAAFERGEIALGGCCIVADSPAWECRACKHRFVSPVR